MESRWEDTQGEQAYVHIANNYKMRPDTQATMLTSSR